MPRAGESRRQAAAVLSWGVFLEQGTAVARSTRAQPRGVPTRKRLQCVPPRPVCRGQREPVPWPVPLRTTRHRPVTSRPGSSCPSTSTRDLSPLVCKASPPKGPESCSGVVPCREEPKPYWRWRREVRDQVQGQCCRVHAETSKADPGGKAAGPPPAARPQAALR